MNSPSSFTFAVVEDPHVIQAGKRPIIIEPAPQQPPRSLAVRDVEEELRAARRAHPGRFNSAHEGFAVLKEEVDELWDEVKARDRDMSAMREEAIQVAAMALRFIEDVCDAPVLSVSFQLSKGGDR